MVTDNTRPMMQDGAIATTTIDTSNGELFSAYTNSLLSVAEIINLTPRQEPIVKLATYNDLLPFQKWWGKYKDLHPHAFCIPTFNPDILKICGAEIADVDPIEVLQKKDPDVKHILMGTVAPLKDAYDCPDNAGGIKWGISSSGYRCLISIANLKNSHFVYCLKIKNENRNKAQECNISEDGNELAISLYGTEHKIIEFGLCPQSFANFGTAKAFIQALKNENPLKMVQNFLLPKQIDEKGDQRINLMSEPNLDNNVKSYPAFEFNGQILCYYPGKKDKYEKQRNGYYYHRGVEDINNVLVIKPLQWIETEQGDLISLPCIGGISPSKIEDFLTKDPLGLRSLLSQQKCAQHQQLPTDPTGKICDYTTTS